jgi:L-asparaginase
VNKSSEVLLLATGDTIAHRHDASPPAVLSGAELLAEVAVPATVAVTVEDVLAEPGWDRDPATMLAVARRVAAAPADGFAGVVVTHGLATIDDTALLTDLLAGPVRAVFTGADCADADAGRANLTAALTAAAAPELHGTVTCLAGELRTPLGVPVGTVAGRATLTAPLPPRPPRATGVPEPDVALISTYPGIPAALLTTAADLGARGVVLAGSPAGEVPVELFGAIDDLVTADVAVVVPGHGRGCTAGLVEQVGAIRVAGLTARQARVATMVALGDGGVARARAWFAAYP